MKKLVIYAITAITALEALALAKGIDGVGLASALGAISSIIGYYTGKKRGERKHA